jgi:hypothetical protein
MIAIVNRGEILPTRRVQLYDRSVDVLLEHWRIQDAIEHEKKTMKGIDALDATAKKVLLTDLATRMRPSSGSYST